MKNKIYKKIGLLSISALIALSPLIQVNAADDTKECETVKYTNYYFFSGIYTESELNKLIEDGANQYNGTFFPKLPTNAKNTVEKKVCLSNEEDDDQCLKTDLNLNDFYSVYKKIMKANQVKTFSVKYTGKGSTEKTEDTKVLYLTEGKTTYYLHDKWYITDENYNVTSDTSKNIVRYQDKETDELIKGAVIPSFTGINLISAGEEGTMFNVGRRFKEGDNTGKTGFDMPSYSETEKVYLTPALYKITYEAEECTEKKYKAEIDYVNKDTNKEVHDPYKKDDFSNGSKDSVDSPKIDGCTLVDEDDSTVDYTIDNTDYQKTVYYSCKAESPAVNPKTGNALIFIAWVVGLGSLGYSIYWFKKNKKEEV